MIAFDRAVTLEDKRILETTDYDVPLSISKEQHMFTARPGIAMRQKIAALLRKYGEIEQTRQNQGINGLDSKNGDENYAETRQKLNELNRAPASSV